MQTDYLESTIKSLMAPGRGILAADESHATIARRFAPFAIEPTEENRRRYRQMLFTTPGWTEYISGVILFDETLRQRADDGRRFVEILVESGITPGIKVDRGAQPLAGAPGERITEGLDGLRERLGEYRTLGARFAKWRAGIVFLSGGQDAQAATAHLNAMNAMPTPHPWPLSFSFARALQAPALEAWRGEPGNVPAGQRAFYHRARWNSAAREGRYTPELEQAADALAADRRA